jgi:hypothetical protein
MAKNRSVIGGGKAGGLKPHPHPLSAMSDSEPELAAREHLLVEEADILEAVLAVADAVAADWPELADGRRATPDRDAVVPLLRAALEESGLLRALTGLLAAAVEAAGYELAARPVPSPPYVVVSSTGPVLRATVADGRLVVNIDCFEVVRGTELGGENGVAYARTAATPADALSVSFARSG